MKYITIETIINALCISRHDTDKIRDVIFKTQKYYNIFSRFANKFKFTHYKTVIDVDLNLVPLTVPHWNTIILIQDKFKYMFSLQNLINIIETALCNSPCLFIEPLVPKNPYNNHDFDKSTNIKHKDVPILCDKFKIKKNLIKPLYLS